jgi:hypothetical protein
MTFVPSLGDAGTWGAPYGWIGPQGAPVWEEYRKGWDDHVPAYPEATVVDAGPDGLVLYDQVRQGYGANDGGLQTYHAPGTFFGPVHALRSPPNAHVRFFADGGPGVDVRFCFVEDSAPDGGEPLSAMVAWGGGDDGRIMDPWYGAPVDGLCFYAVLFPFSPTWQMWPANATLFAAGSQLVEVQRTTYVPTMTFNQMTPAGAYFDLGIPVSQAIETSWDIRTLDGGVTLEAFFGSSSVDWVIDNGTTVHGLTNPGNSDDAGYQGGTLDLPSLVPVFFVGSQLESTADPLPSETLEVGVAGARPILSGLPSSVDAGATTSVTVTALDQEGSVATTYGSTVAFSSTDPDAGLPAPYTFATGDVGARTFQVSFATPGHQTLTVFDVETPPLASAQATFVTPPPDAGTGPAQPYKVGCGCSGGVAPAWLACLMAILTAASRRLRRDETPRSRSGDRRRGHSGDGDCA